MTLRADKSLDSLERIFSGDGEFQPRPLPNCATIKYADITIDVHASEASRGGRLLRLTATEFRLLKVLMEQPERAFTRVQLKEAVWGRGVKLELSSINSYLGRLRQVLNAKGEPNLIRTITGYGYSIDETFCGVK